MVRPLDTLPEVLLLGLIARAAWLHPAFLHRFAVRAVVIAILAMKIVAALVLQQQGWCVAFTPAKPMVRESTGKPHSWDIRADWLADDPDVLRGDDEELPRHVRAPRVVLQSAASTMRRTAGMGGRDSDSRRCVWVHRRRRRSRWRSSGPGWVLAARRWRTVDAREPGHHQVAFRRHTGFRSKPCWPPASANRAGVERHPMESMFFPMTTIKPPSRSDRIARPIGTSAPVTALRRIGARWLASFALRLGDHGRLIWSTAAAAAVSTAAMLGSRPKPRLTRQRYLMLSCSSHARRFHNARGKRSWSIGVPWLAHFAAANLHQVGADVVRRRQRHPRSARLLSRVHEHFWLEGGQVTFWNQPFDRWIVARCTCLR